MFLNSYPPKLLSLYVKGVVQGYFRATFLPIFISRIVVLEGCYMSYLDQNATCKPYSNFTFLVL